jgi:hypothetical protein
MDTPSTSQSDQVAEREGGASSTMETTSNTPAETKKPKTAEKIPKSKSKKPKETQKVAKSKSKKAQEVVPSDSEDSSSRDDSESDSDDSNSSDSESDSETETEKDKKKRKAKQKARRKAKEKRKVKSKKKARKEVRVARRGFLTDANSSQESDSDSDSDSDSESSPETESEEEDDEIADQNAELQQLIQMQRLQLQGLGQAGLPQWGSIPPPRPRNPLAGGAARLQAAKKARQLAALGLDAAGIKKSKKEKKTKRKRASKLEFKRVDQLWDSTIHNYKLTDTAEDEESSEYDQYLFNVRRTFDWEGKYKVRHFTCTWGIGVC